MLSVEEIMFLKGDVAIKVSTDEQSEWLINFVENNGYPQNPNDEDIIKVDTYKEYPYYYIEDRFQLQASKEMENYFGYEHYYEEVFDFEDYFGDFIYPSNV